MTKFRLATEADQLAIRMLECAGSCSAGAEAQEYVHGRMLRDALQGGVEANAVIWLAEQDGELQGLLGQEVSSLLEESATYLRIAAVARRFAGQGIGDAMVQHALDQARSDGLQAACAHTPPDNTPARALLYRNNFEELGEVRDGFQLWGRLLH